MNRPLFFCCLISMMLWANLALAQPHHEGVHVENAWARATPPVVKTGAAYLKIVNSGKSSDRMIGVESPIAKKAQMHTHLMADNIMRMRQVKSIEVMPGMPLTFRPSGYHIMLIGLKKPLKAGDHFPLTLIFEKAGKMTVDVQVRNKNKKPNSGSGMHQDHKRNHR